MLKKKLEELKEKDDEDEEEEDNNRDDIQDKWIINLINRVKKLENNFQKWVEESTK